MTEKFMRKHANFNWEGVKQALSKGFEKGTEFAKDAYNSSADSVKAAINEAKEGNWADAAEGVLSNPYLGKLIYGAVPGLLTYGALSAGGVKNRGVKGGLSILAAIAGGASQDKLNDLIFQKLHEERQAKREDLEAELRSEFAKGQDTQDAIQMGERAERAHQAEEENYLERLEEARRLAENEAIGAATPMNEKLERIRQAEEDRYAQTAQAYGDYAPYILAKQQQKADKERKDLNKKLEEQFKELKQKERIEAAEKKAEERRKQVAKENEIRKRLNKMTVQQEQATKDNQRLYEFNKAMGLFGNM